MIDPVTLTAIALSFRDAFARFCAGLPGVAATSSWLNHRTCRQLGDIHLALFTNDSTTWDHPVPTEGRTV